MRPFIIVAVLVLSVALIAFASGCGQDEEQAIKDTMTGFLTAYNNDDFEGCLDYISTGLRESKGDETLVADLKAGTGASGSAIMESISIPEIDGENAKIPVSFRGFIGQVNTVKFALIKESGQWKING